MSRQLSVRRSRFQPFAAPVIAEPLQDCVAPKAHFTVSPPQDGFAVANLGQPRKLSGLKARLTFGLSTKSLHESRFQRLSCEGIKFVGRCPTLQLKIAPLALNRAKVKKLVRTTHHFPLVPLRSVKRANSATDCTFIFAITWARCILTVASVTPRSSATCLFNCPAATCSSTSRSRV